ncbi:MULTISPECIES: hypothetical protein [unclassified Selenomonas]|uniref:hypothetical protein n=1 Tax=unclassified Selenomonas TaxID=2637378 RepID=UPI0001EB29C0|nr:MULTISPECIES: hypothetical protein [unclassified Selenomonas]EFR40759.1 hypothetical protein HMPREF9162_2128 [Selenomonas sp. oral taxon 137 str. F0430]EKU70626.1 hypothetical protein HMPREF9161_01672 [Selenomonas sp. F0473]
MRKKRSFKILSGMLVAAAVLVAVPLNVPAAQARSYTSAQEMDGMPNPMVEYQSVAEAAQAAGYYPLSLSELTGYQAEHIYVIAGDLIDIRYARIRNDNAKLLVRTAPANLMQNDDISGIYGATWKKVTMRGVPVSIAEVKDENGMTTNYAAHWAVGDYLFAVQSEGISYTAFMRALLDGPVDLSVNYFTKIEHHSMDDDTIPY